MAGRMTSAEAFAIVDEHVRLYDRCEASDGLVRAAAALKEYEAASRPRGPVSRVEVLDDHDCPVAHFEIETIATTPGGDHLALMLTAANRASAVTSYLVVSSDRKRGPVKVKDVRRYLAPLAPASGGEWHEPAEVEYRAEKSAHVVLDFKVVGGTLPLNGSTPPLRPFVRFAPDSLLMRKLRLADAVLAWEEEQAKSPLWQAVTHPTFRDQVLEAIADVHHAVTREEVRDEA